MNTTPFGGKGPKEETSAYRSYRKRELQKNGGQQIKLNQSLDKFSDAVELLNKNKVNKANAFENRIMDLTEILFKEFAEDGNQESLWQRYSTLIEACGKIYGYCVDSVHSDTIGILQGLNRTGCIQEELEENAQDKKKKKKILGGSNTLDTESNISTTKFDKFENYDSFFKSIASNFHPNSFNGLLLNKISSSNKLDLVFVSESVMSEDLEVSNAMISFPEIDLNFASNLNLGEKLQKFSGQPFVETSQNELVNLNESFLDEVQTESDFCEETEEEEKELETHENFLEGNVELAMRISQLAEDDYKFFSKPSAWAGFDYAKGIICLSKKIGEKEPRKKKEQSAFKLDQNFEVDLQRIFPKSKKLKINKSKKEAAAKLPEDFRFTMKRFTKLFTRPYTFIKNVKDKEGKQKNLVVDAGSESEDNLMIDNFDNDLAPEVDEVNPLYNSKSKQVNIKLLKDTLSESISNMREVKFLDVIDKLPNHLPQTEISQLSVHVCFIGILHLANENNLMLNSTGLCNFKISKNS